MGMTAGQAAAALTDLPLTELLSTALATHAAELAEAVRNSLTAPPGGPHDQPWRETGGLQGSIASSADGLVAQVGSNDPAAAPQELGTATVPPRPFLAPAAAAAADQIARDIGETLADLLRDRLK
jgi:phage gpG-like protein